MGVDEACGGMRSLQAAIMIAFFVGEAVLLGWGRRLLLVAAAGAEAIDLGIVADRIDEIESRLRDGIARADAVIVSGGVSVGPYDVVKVGFEAVGQVAHDVPELRELEQQLKDSGAEAIVILENFAHTLESVIGEVPVKHVVVASLGDMLGGKGAIGNFVVRHVKKLVPALALPRAQRFNAALAEGAGKPFEPFETGHDDIAFLQYTGGTTGYPKGVMWRHEDIWRTLGGGIDFMTGEIKEISVGPANEDEIAQTIKVMGGDDWMLWMKALLEGIGR